jgi:hypothetical protein
MLPALPAAEIAALAGAGAGDSGTAVTRTVLPEGVAALTAPPPPDPRTTAAAAGILVIIGTSAIGLAGWRRSQAAA